MLLPSGPQLRARNSKPRVNKKCMRVFVFMSNFLHRSISLSCQDFIDSYETLSRNIKIDVSRRHRRGPDQCLAKMMPLLKTAEYSLFCCFVQLF